MTTLWWIIVVALTGTFAFLAGYVVRAEFDRYRQVYDIDFTRKQVGT